MGSTAARRPPRRRPGSAGRTRRCAPAQAASGSRYCFQVAGIVGEASWMNTFGLGIRGLTRGCIPIWCGSRSPLRRLHGRARGDDVLPVGAAALRARDDVVDGQRGAGAAVQALPAIAGEHRAAGDLALVRVARDPHVGHEPDHHRLRHRPARPVQVVRPDLDDLGLLLEQEHGGAPDRADVDRLVRRVEHQHTTTRPTACAVGVDPCRWWSASGTDPTGPGGTAVAIAGRSVEAQAVASDPRARTTRGPGPPRNVRPVRRSPPPRPAPPRRPRDRRRTCSGRARSGAAATRSARG